MIMALGDVFVVASVFSHGLLVTAIKKLSVIAKQRGSHFGLCLNLQPAVQIKQNGIQLFTFSSYKILFDHMIPCITIHI